MSTEIGQPLEIVHLGVGAFHIAHQAWYLQRLHDANDRTWSITAGDIRTGGEATLDALRNDGGAYVLETLDPTGIRNYESIRAVRRVLPYVPGVAELVAAGASGTTRIISFTVTEAGYSLDADHVLDLDHEAIRSDLRALVDGETGTTLYAVLVASLRARMANGAGPVTLLCCDNLRHNGERSRAALLKFIDALGDTALHEWVESHTTSPNAMVDRITPRAGADVAARVAAATGANGLTAVSSESFRQWVIEDRFIAGRPAWQHVGVKMVNSVAPYEEAKIRLLNAAHSCIAWAGALAGHEYIHEGARDPLIRQIAYAYATQDAIPVLQPSPVDLPAYRDSVLERFTNPAIRDTIARVASDSFAKIPGFIAPTITDRLRRGETMRAVAVLAALFLSFVRRWQAGQLAFEYMDGAVDTPLVQRLMQSADPVADLCSSRALWGEAAGQTPFVSAVRKAWHELPGSWL